MDHLEVANPDRLGKPLFLQFFEGRPAVKEGPLNWPVDHQKVDVVQPQLVEGVLNGCNCTAGTPGFLRPPWWLQRVFHGERGGQ